MPLQIYLYETVILCEKFPLHHCQMEPTKEEVKVIHKAKVLLPDHLQVGVTGKGMVMKRTDLEKFRAITLRKGEGNGEDNEEEFLLQSELKLSISTLNVFLLGPKTCF